MKGFRPGHEPKNKGPMIISFSTKGRSWKHRLILIWRIIRGKNIDIVLNNPTGKQS